MKLLYFIALIVAIASMSVSALSKCNGEGGKCGGSGGWCCNQPVLYCDRTRDICARSDQAGLPHP